MSPPWVNGGIFRFRTLIDLSRLLSLNCEGFVETITHWCSPKLAAENKANVGAAKWVSYINSPRQKNSRGSRSSTHRINGSCLLLYSLWTIWVPSRLGVRARCLKSFFFCSSWQKPSEEQALFFLISLLIHERPCRLADWKTTIFLMVC